MKDFITFEHISKPMLFPKKNMFTEDWATATSVYIGGGRVRIINIRRKKLKFILKCTWGIYGNVFNK